MNPNYINDTDALVWATHYAVEVEFFYCLDRGDDLNVQDEHGRTALHAAAEEGWTYYAAILIERGADVHKADMEGDTPLDYAVFHEHHEIAELLRGHGARDRDGPSARQKLEDAVYEGFASVDAAKRLLSMIEEQKSMAVDSIPTPSTPQAEKEPHHGRS
ncbi:MAG: ankyrin repeat domain-containing protein [Verrucomicrobia bacterium]|nr:ankyrin repeat domain-containing protein [Verrucomicrobiota bacterium]